MNETRAAKVPLILFMAVVLCLQQAKCTPVTVIHVFESNNSTTTSNSQRKVEVNDVKVQEFEFNNVKAQEEVNETKLNHRPIIGILSQELSLKMEKFFGKKNYSSYIAASYVKFIESAGARVVPVIINQTQDYYENLTNYLNGFLFPGGSVPFTSEYAKAAKLIYELIKEKANTTGKGSQTNGGALPLLTTCLGFEYMLFFEAGQNPLTRCAALNRADSLQFQPGYRGSQLFGNMSEYLVTSLATKNITSNFHRWCILPQTFDDLGLNNTMVILSTTYDENGLEYVSTVEHRQLPIYGTQWHPEKAAFEWAEDPKHDAIPHSLEAVQVSQAVAETFVQKARENSNKYPSKEEEQRSLIYNYSPTYVALAYNSSFQLCYFF